MKTVKIVAIVLVVAFIAIQFVPVKRDNPRGPDTFAAPAEVKEIVKRSCYDCHSNQTFWPWYTYFAPASWIASGHVHEAREHLNFINWEKMSPEEQAHAAHEMAEEVEDGEMPPSMYLLFHTEAKIGEEHEKALATWAHNLEK